VIEDAGGRGFLGDPIVSGATCGMTIAGIVGPCRDVSRCRQSARGAERSGDRVDL
jgi:hypothetical protein